MDQSGPMLLQFIPSLVLGIIYAIVVFIVARKRRMNP